MSLKKIYLIRHGQTDFNKNGIVQGRGIDASLNDEGRKQAAAFYQAYQNVPFDKIYISELKRTRESVQKFIDKGVPVEALDGLNEIGWGVAEGTHFTGKNKHHYFDILQHWQEGHIHEKVEQGESPFEVQQRQQKALDKILSQDEEKTVLICMHGRAIRILLCWIQGLSLGLMDTFPHHNLCLYELEYADNKFEVKTFNDIRHLVDT